MVICRNLCELGNYISHDAGIGLQIVELNYLNLNIFPLTYFVFYFVLNYASMHESLTILIVIFSISPTSSLPKTHTHTQK